MRLFKIEDMVKGWIIGNFTPSVIKTEKFEVGYHVHSKNDITKSHYHKRSTEVNVIIKGKMIVNSQVLVKGDIFVLDPYTVSESEFLEDTELIVIRDASYTDDKYLI